MMNARHWIVLLTTVGWLLVQAGVSGRVLAQEEKLAHEDVFGKLQRPPVPIDHDLHMEVLEDEGCGACHHEYDNDKGLLVPVEDDGTSCTECHGAGGGSAMDCRECLYQGSVLSPPEFGPATNPSHNAPGNRVAF